MFLRVIKSAVIMSFIFAGGCSFESQPLYKAELHVDAKKNDKVTESFKVSLNDLVFKDKNQRFMKFYDVEISPAFVAHQNGNDQYRIKYVDANESNLLEIKFDGGSKTMVWENANYSVFIIPL